MYKLLFELLTAELTLPIEPLHEYIIMAIIGAIAFSVGWDVSPGGNLGSLIHWAVRLVVFVVLWFVTGIVLLIAQWAINNWVLVVSVVAIILASIAAFFIIRLLRKKKIARVEDAANERNEKQRN